MKSLGIVRKVDELGRVVLPVEIRREFVIKEKDGIEFFTDGDSIVLKKYDPGCTLCGDINDLKEFYGKPICCKCREKVKKL